MDDLMPMRWAGTRRDPDVVALRQGLEARERRRRMVRVAFAATVTVLVAVNIALFGGLVPGVSVGDRVLVAGPLASPAGGTQGDAGTAPATTQDQPAPGGADPAAPAPGAPAAPAPGAPDGSGQVPGAAAPHEMGADHQGGAAAPAPDAQGQATSPQPPSTAVSPASPGGLATPEQQVLDLVNATRAEAGCPALTVDPRLVTSAEAHAADMIADGYFSHESPEGSSPTDRAQAAGYPDGVAENIATGYPNAQEVVTGWLDSPGHRANIMECSYTVTGIGHDPGGLSGYSPGMWVQVFGFGA